MTSRPFKSWRRFLIALGSVAVVFVVFGLFHQGYEFQKTLDRKFLDAVIQSGGGPEEREDFVLLGIDEDSLSLNIFSEEEIEGSKTLKLMDSRFPWDRRVWAETVDKLCEAGAKLVILDLVFAEPGTPEEDDALAAAIARHPEKVVLAGLFSPIGQQEDGHQVFTFTEPYVQFLESDPEPRIGFANFWPDIRDSIIRSARFRSSVGKESNLELKGEYEYYSIAGQIMDAYGLEVPDEDQVLRFTAQSLKFKDDSGNDQLEKRFGADVYRPRSVARIFSDTFWKTNFDDGAFFKDKVVLIGPVAERFQDFHETPVGRISGPQLHLQVAACGLESAFITHTGHPLVMMGIMGLLTTLIAGLIDKPRWSALAIVGLLVAFVLTVWIMAEFQNVMIPVAGGVITAVIGWVSVIAYQLVRERMEKDRLRGTFRRFVSRDVADRLVDNPKEWEAIAEGRKRQVVVLFSDVRGFTSRSETAEPSELVTQLNEYLTEMVAVVFKHGGTLDKFIGDAVMVHWGSLDENEGGRLDGDHCRAALAAAQDMQAELDKLNKRWAKQGREPFQIGIGIHLGEVVAAELGSPERIEFGVIGDAVNLASRLEGLTKAFDCDIVFSDSVNAAAQTSGATPLGPVVVKGRAKAEDLFAYGDEAKIQKALEGMDRDGNGAIVMRSK